MFKFKPDENTNKTRTDLDLVLAQELVPLIDFEIQTWLQGAGVKKDYPKARVSVGNFGNIVVELDKREMDKEESFDSGDIPDNRVEFDKDKPFTTKTNVFGDETGYQQEVEKAIERAVDVAMQRLPDIIASLENRNV